MDSFTLDCRQLANLDISTLPAPSPITVPPKKPLSAKEQSAVRAALKAGRSVSSTLAIAQEIADLAARPIRGTLLAPAAMPVLPRLPVIKFSKSNQVTVAIGAAGSLAAVLGVMGSGGFYGSTTPEVGVYATVGGAIVFNSPGASFGVEVTFVLGTPVDFSGPYFGIGIGAGSAATVTGTLLFSPTLPLTNPLELTLMGISINYSASTPTRLPVTLTIEVTDTAIWGIKF